ncbi:MAG: hypothetical protein AAF555_05680 [Verrucomicrobiota bacterium]
MPLVRQIPDLANAEASAAATEAEQALASSQAVLADVQAAQAAAESARVAAEAASATATEALSELQLSARLDAAEAQIAALTVPTPIAAFVFEVPRYLDTDGNLSAAAQPVTDIWLKGSIPANQQGQVQINDADVLYWLDTVNIGSQSTSPPKNQHLAETAVYYVSGEAGDKTLKPFLRRGETAPFNGANSIYEHAGNPGALRAASAIAVFIDTSSWPTFDSKQVVWNILYHVNGEHEARPGGSDPRWRVVEPKWINQHPEWVE